MSVGVVPAFTQNLKTARCCVRLDDVDVTATNFALVLTTILTCNIFFPDAEVKIQVFRLYKNVTLCAIILVRFGDKN